LPAPASATAQCTSPNDTPIAGNDARACSATDPHAPGAGAAPASSRRQRNEAESTKVENGAHWEAPGRISAS
jgi:hypothetical protein